MKRFFASKYTRIPVQHCLFVGFVRPEQVPEVMPYLRCICDACEAACSGDTVCRLTDSGVTDTARGTDTESDLDGGTGI